MADKHLVVTMRLKHDDNFLKLCLMRIYLAQEIDEQMGQFTTHRNGIGFNKADAPILSPLAYKLEQETMEHGVPLTKTELAIARHHMVKYVDQIIRITPEEKLL